MRRDSRGTRSLAALALLAPALLGPAESARAGEPSAEEALARRIREATSRATRALASAYADDLAPQATRGRPLPGPRAGMRGDATLLALALLRAGGPGEKKVAARLLDEWWSLAVRGGSGNYQLALGVSALEGTALHRIDPPHPTTVSRYEARPLLADDRARLEEAAHALIEGHYPTGGDRAGYGWSYTTAPIVSVSTTTREREHPGTGDRPRPPARFDNSNTQFSVLGLHDAARGGVAIPREVAVGIAEHFLACASTEAVPAGKTVTGGSLPVRWGYVGGAAGTPAMTFAGLACLAVARELGAKGERIDAAIAGGLSGIGTLIPRGRGPRGAMHDAYLLYSIEKALDLLRITELDGRDWFADLATDVLDAQGADGLWGDADSTALYVLFLTRATVTEGRVVDHRTTGRGQARQGEGDVYLARTKKFVNAVDLLERWASPPAAPAPSPAPAPPARRGGRAPAPSPSPSPAKSSPPPKPPTTAEVEEAVRALAAEGHGRDACLLPALARLLEAKDGKREKAAAWLSELAGTPVSSEQAKAAAAQIEGLGDAPGAADLRALLVPAPDAPTVLLPLRAFAATALGLTPGGDARDVVLAADALAGSPLLASAAGSRCARAYADALCALRCPGLPELAPDKPVSRDSLQALAATARVRLAKAVETEAKRALEAHAQAQEDPAAWRAARDRLATLGKAGLEALVSLGGERARAEAAFAVLRAVTGELIPDDADAWRAWIELHG